MASPTGPILPTGPPTRPGQFPGGSLATEGLGVQCKRHCPLQPLEGGLGTSRWHGPPNSAVSVPTALHPSPLLKNPVLNNQAPALLGLEAPPVRLSRVVGATGTSGPSTRRSLTGGASKPYRAGAGLFSTGFFKRGLGWRAVGADTAEFDGPPQRLVPKPPSTGC